MLHAFDVVVCNGLSFQFGLKILTSQWVCCPSFEEKVLKTLFEIEEHLKGKIDQKKLETGSNCGVLSTDDVPRFPPLLMIVCFNWQILHTFGISSFHTLLTGNLREMPFAVLPISHQNHCDITGLAILDFSICIICTFESNWQRKFHHSTTISYFWTKCYMTILQCQFYQSVTSGDVTPITLLFSAKKVIFLEFGHIGGEGWPRCTYNPHKQGVDLSVLIAPPAGKWPECTYNPPPPPPPTGLSLVYFTTPPNTSNQHGGGHFQGNIYRPTDLCVSPVVGSTKRI